LEEEEEIVIMKYMYLTIFENITKIILYIYPKILMMKKILLVFVSIILSVNHLYCQKGLNEFIKGNRNLCNGNPSKLQLQNAIQFYDKAIILNDCNYTYYGMRGIAQRKLGNYTNALANFSKGLNILNNKKILTIEEEDDKKKLILYTTSTDLILNDTTFILINLAKVYDDVPTMTDILVYDQFGGEHIDSISIFKLIEYINRKLENHNFDKKLYLYRGYLNRYLGKKENSIQDFKKFTQYNQDNSKVFANIGFLFEELEIIEDAIDYYSKAINMSPDNTDYYYDRGNIFYFKLNDYDNAMIDYKKSWEISQTFGIARQVGNLLIQQKKYEEAIVWCDEVIKGVWNLSYGKIELYKIRAKAKENSKDIAGSIQDYSAIISLDKLKCGDTYDALLKRGILKTQLNDYRGAISDLDEVIKVLNLSNHRLAYFYRAFSRNRINNNKGALEDYNYLLKIDINNAEAYFNRGLILIQNKANKNLACLDFSKAGELGLKDAYDMIEKYCN
jgi:tetratricopeptide (TPR) repeat protein